MRRHGFTLIELMVVVLIIAILGAVLLYAMTRATSAAKRVRGQADLQAIATALEAYKQDFGDYPRPGTAAPTQGAQALYMALVGPTGTGFQARAGGQGRVYGPYINTEKLDIDTGNQVIRSRVYPGIDAANPAPPILYYVARPVGPAGGAPDISAAGTYLNDPAGTYPAGSSAVLYDGRQNSGYDATLWLTGSGLSRLNQMRLMLGDRNTDGGIGVGETAATTGPYLLWMAGANGSFGLMAPPAAGDKYSTTDITNFDIDTNQVLVK